MAKGPTDVPHPDLLPYLEKHDLSWEVFAKGGRPPKGVSAKRQALVTEMHETGMTWDRMVEVTGKSLGFVQRNTNACWNEASKRNRQESAAKVARARKGEKKPWLTEQLKADWEDGKFDFHKGRVRSEEERQKLKDSWTPELRKAHSDRRKELWQDPEYRDTLLDFHRSPEERARRSRAQAQRMQDNPEKWTRGKGSWIKVSKCLGKETLWVRSTWEAAAVRVLEEDSSVVAYEYEKRFELETGVWLLPDFLVHYQDSKTLVEVKAAWVLDLEDTHDVSVRLKQARKIAQDNDWPFEVWTEKDRLKDALFGTAK